MSLTVKIPNCISPSWAPHLVPCICMQWYRTDAPPDLFPHPPGQFQHRLGGFRQRDSIAAAMPPGVAGERLPPRERGARVPSARRRGRSLVGREHVVEERAAEQGEHREIRLPMAAMGGG